MSVNLVYAIDQRKIAHMGKHFGSIDFNVAAATKTSIDRLGRQVHAGELIIAEKKYRLTIAQIDDLIIDTCTNGQFIIFGDKWELSRFEVDRVVETLKSAKHVFLQKYRLGL